MRPSCIIACLFLITGKILLHLCEFFSLTKAPSVFSTAEVWKTNSCDVNKDAIVYSAKLGLKDFGQKAPTIVSCAYINMSN